MTRQVSWPRILAEGIAIVVSILLAFGLQAWWENTQAKAEEARALTSLAADFAANEAALQTTIDLHNSSMERIWRLLELSPRMLGELPLDSVADYVFAAFDFSTFNSQNATVDELVASGNLAVLTDERLRQLLVRWQNGVEDIGENSNLVMSAGEEVLRRVGELGGPWAWTGAVYEHPAPNADARAAILDSQFRGLARVKRVQSGGYLNELYGLRNQVNEISDLLDQLSQ